MVSKMTDIGICDGVIEVDVNTTSMVNIISIIVSTHIRANIRCFCCVERLMIVIVNAIYRVILVSSITGA